MSEQEATLDEFIEESDNPDRKSVRWGPKKKTIPGDWNFDPIINHASEIIYPQRDKPTRFDGDIPWVRIEDLDGVYISEPTDGERYVSRELMDEMNLRSFPKGTLMCSCSTTMGVCAITTRELLSNQTFAGIVTKDTINTHYLYYAISDCAEELDQLATGSTISYLSSDKLEDFHIPTPPLSEQRKIATVLHTVDQAIQKTGEIIEQGKQIQESLKTELFTTGYSDWEVKESTEWRCRANKFPRDWEVKPAEELMEITRGASPRPRSDDSLFGGDIPWIKIGDADRNESKRIESVDSYVTEKGKKKSKFVQEDTLLVANSGATCGFSVFAGVDGCVHDGWLILGDYDRFSPDFLYHYINWNYNYLQSLSLGSAQTNLSTSLFGRLDIPIPPIEEQNKIVDTLDSVGRVISENKRELDPLRRLKRGLMQDLLSGEVRTTDIEIDIPEKVAKYG